MGVWRPGAMLQLNVMLVLIIQISSSCDIFQFLRFLHEFGCTVFVGLMHVVSSFSSRPHLSVYLCSNMVLLFFRMGNSTLSTTGISSTACVQYVQVRFWLGSVILAVKFLNVLLIYCDVHLPATYFW